MGCKRIICAVSVLLLMACPKKKTDVVETPTTTTLPDYTPSLASISTTDKLHASSSISSLALASSGTAETLNGTGYTGASPLAAANAFAAVSGSGVSTTGSGSVSGAGATAFNAAQSFTAHFTVSTTFPAGASAACSFLNNYSALTCNASGFDIASSDITGGAIQIKAFASNGSASASLNSNSLVSHKYTFQQISNTRNNLNDFGANFNMAFYNGELFVKLATPPGAEKLHKFNPADGTMTIFNNFINGSDDSPDYYTVLNNKLYYGVATNMTFTSDVVEYDSSNPSAKTFTQISNIDTSANGDRPTDLFVYNNKLFFFAKNPAGTGLKMYRYDGTAIVQITALANVNVDDKPASGGFHYAIYNNKLYFGGAKSATDVRLFEYDDAAGTLKQISNINASVAYRDLPRYLTVHNNKLYFNANNAAGYSKLFSFDGSAIVQVSNTAGLTVSDNPSNLMVYNSRLYFRTATNATTQKLARLENDNSITLISNTCSACSDDPYQLTVYDNVLFFSARSTATTFKLYKYDSNVAQVELVADLSGPANSDAPTNLVVYAGKLYFASAMNASGHRKIYNYMIENGSPQLTQVSNLVNNGTDLASSNFKLLLGGNSLYFNGGTAGANKLYRLCDKDAGC